MASYCYFLMFPGPHEKLVPEEVLQAMEEAGYSCSSTISLAVPIEEEGHIFWSEKMRSLPEPRFKEAARLLQQGEQIYLDFLSFHTPLTGCFMTQIWNPYIEFHLRVRGLREFSREECNAFFTMMLIIAERARAAYVLFMGEPTDDFEDHFIEIDGKRYIDKVYIRTKRPTSAADFFWDGYLVRHIYVNRELRGDLPEGLPQVEEEIEVGEGWVEYVIQSPPTAMTLRAVIPDQDAARESLSCSMFLQPTWIRGHRKNRLVRRLGKHVARGVPSRLPGSSPPGKLSGG